MNFVGHIKVALDQLDARSRNDDGDGGPMDGGEDPEALVVGAALPDIAAIGRFRLSGTSSDNAVRAGVALHHRTDDAFHSHRWFRQHNGSVAAALADIGVRRGAARAVGHVGVELLLDGYLLATDPNLGRRAEAALATVTAPGRDLVSLVDPDRRPDWSTHLDRTARWPVPADYRDPAAVAGRLQRILAHRPRLSFGTEQVAAVADVLAEARAGLEAGADDLVADLAELVRTNPDHLDGR